MCASVCVCMCVDVRREWTVVRNNSAGVETDNTAGHEPHMHPQPCLVISSIHSLPQPRSEGVVSSRNRVKH